MSRDKAIHQVRQQFSLHDKFILSCDITFMWHWRLCYTMTGKQVDAVINAPFYVMLHSYDIKHLFHENLQGVPKKCPMCKLE